MPAALVPQWLQAQQAYLRQDYAAAYPPLAQLLQGNLEGRERTEICGQTAQCLQHLGRLEEAAFLWEALLREDPNSSHLLHGLPGLYAYYLTAGATEKADALWQRTFTQWRDTPLLWDMIGARARYLANTAPKELPALAELIISLPFTEVVFTESVYRPLLTAGKPAEAQTLHQQIVARLTVRDPADVGRVEHAYANAWTRTIAESFLQSCRDATTAGDLEHARYWIDIINMMIPEYPQAADLRALFDARFPDMRKDIPR